jgi:hypothetical protein
MCKAYGLIATRRKSRSKTMGFRANIVRIMGRVRVDTLTDSQRKELLKSFSDHKRELERLIQAIDKGMDKLKAQPKKKAKKKKK